MLLHIHLKGLAKNNDLLIFHCLNESPNGAPFGHLDVAL